MTGVMVLPLPSRGQSGLCRMSALSELWCYLRRLSRRGETAGCGALLCGTGLSKSIDRPLIPHVTPATFSATICTIFSYFCPPSFTTHVLLHRHFLEDV